VKPIGVYLTSRANDDTPFPHPKILPPPKLLKYQQPAYLIFFFNLIFFPIPLKDSSQQAMPAERSGRPAARGQDMSRKTYVDPANSFDEYYRAPGYPGFSFQRRPLASNTEPERRQSLQPPPTVGAVPKASPTTFPNCVPCVQVFLDTDELERHKAVCPARKEGNQMPKSTEKKAVSASKKYKAMAKEVAPGLVDTTGVPVDRVASVVGETQAAFRFLNQKPVQSSPPAPRFILPILPATPRQEIKVKDVCSPYTMLSFILTF
jgi:hypothetical protein